MLETILPGIHQVRSTAVNSFIVDGDEGVILIDTGLPGRHRRIHEAVSSLGRAIEDVRAILLTHAHPDHVGGAAALKADSGALLCASPAASVVISGERPAHPPPALDRPFVRPIFRVLPGSRSTAVDHMVGEHEVSPLPSDLSVIDTPGHTRGHVSFLLDRHNGVLFAGDAAVANKRGEIKRGWMNRSTPTLDASLGHIAEFDFEVACFGHAPPIESSAADAFRRFATSLT